MENYGELAFCNFLCLPFIIVKKKHEIYKMSGCTGTLRYMAPEIIFNNGEDYDLKIDIYSLQESWVIQII